MRGEDSFSRARWAGKPFVPARSIRKPPDAHFPLRQARFMKHHPAVPRHRTSFARLERPGGAGLAAFAAPAYPESCGPPLGANIRSTHPDLAAALVHFLS
ncbi:MAG: hypothetical protein IPH39_00010 [Sulfuritalea sp.]|nr:hypothetical protein [Sulfuritalea sp.]